MFFYRELDRIITLHPSFFGPRIHDYLTHKLYADVEGTNTGDYFIICVTDVVEISEGKVLPGSAMAEFTVNYRAMVWRPFKGETLDAVVSSVVANGVFIELGAISSFVSQSQIPSEIRYNGNATPPCWTDGGSQVIERGTHLRVKVLGVRQEVGNMYVICTMREDYLGVLDPDEV